jgi:hypothetical protein
MWGEACSGIWRILTMTEPILASDANLSYAWAKALLGTAEHSQGDPPPLCMSVTGFERGEPIEDPAIREAVDSELKSRAKVNRVSVSAMVVFPYKAWVRRGRTAYTEFRTWCLDRLVPRLEALDVRNQKGLYFERMMAYEHFDSDGAVRIKDQLRHVIDWWRDRKKQGKRPRRSGLQVTCFDPCKDQTKMPRSGFPCLQQVGLAYEPNDKDSLIINAFYPTQFILDRGYGNYLGLCHLGAFLSHEIGVKLVRMNCFVGCAQLGHGVTRKRIRPLLDLLERVVPMQ